MSTLTIYDRVKEATSTSGTGSIALSGAVTGFQSFASTVGVGNDTYYVIADQTGSNWEVGVGTLTGTSTLSRNTVLASSNAGSLVSFNTNVKDVFVSCPASILSQIAATSGTVTTASVVTANGFSGTVASPTTTPAITLETTITGVLLGNGTAISAATAGTDYVAPSGSITGTAANVTGVVAVANGGTGDSSLTAYSLLCGGTTSTGAVQSVASLGTSGQVLMSNGAGALPSWSTAGGTGTVTTVSVVSANGFTGTVANATTTPAITIATSVTGILKGNGTAISAATAGTDYLTSNQTITLSGDTTGSGTTSITTTTSKIGGVAATLGGAFTTSGAFTLSLAVTANTSVTLPTSGTLLSTAAAVTAAQGGTGLATLTAHGVMLGEGTSNVAFATIGTAGRLLIDQGSGADPAFEAMSGDIAITSSGATTIQSSAVTSGKIAASAVTYSKIQNESASTLLGNPTGSGAAPSEITLGSGLSFSGTTLTASSSGNLFTGIATVTVANTTSETTLVPTGIGSTTIPSGQVLQGAVFRIKAMGYWSTLAVSAGTITINLKAGSTVLATTGAITNPLSQSNDYWEVEALISVYQAVLSGALHTQPLSQGRFISETATALTTITAGMVNTSTINNGLGTAFDLTATWSVASASNTISLTSMTIESLIG